MQNNEIQKAEWVVLGGIVQKAQKVQGNLVPAEVNLLSMVENGNISIDAIAANYGEMSHLLSLGLISGYLGNPSSLRLEKSGYDALEDYGVAVSGNPYDAAASAEFNKATKVSDYSHNPIDDQTISPDAVSLLERLKSGPLNVARNAAGYETIDTLFEMDFITIGASDNGDPNANLIDLAPKGMQFLAGIGKSSEQQKFGGKYYDLGVRYASDPGARNDLPEERNINQRLDAAIAIGEFREFDGPPDVFAAELNAAMDDFKQGVRDTWERMGYNQPGGTNPYKSANEKQSLTSDELRVLQDLRDAPYMMLSDQRLAIIQDALVPLGMVMDLGNDEYILTEYGRRTLSSAGKSAKQTKDGVPSDIAVRWGNINWSDETSQFLMSLMDGSVTVPSGTYVGDFTTLRMNNLVQQQVGADGTTFTITPRGAQLARELASRLMSFGSKSSKESEVKNQKQLSSDQHDALEFLANSIAGVRLAQTDDQMIASLEQLVQMGYAKHDPPRSGDYSNLGYISITSAGSALYTQLTGSISPSSHVYGLKHQKSIKDPQFSTMILGGIAQSVPPVKKAEKEIQPSDLSTTQGLVLIKVQRGQSITKDTDMVNSLWDAASQLEWLGYITRVSGSLVERQYALTPLGQQAYDWINDYGKFD